MVSKVLPTAINNSAVKLASGLGRLKIISSVLMVPGEQRVTGEPLNEFIRRLRIEGLP